MDWSIENWFWRMNGWRSRSKAVDVDPSSWSWSELSKYSSCNCLRFIYITENANIKAVGTRYVGSYGQEKMIALQTLEKQNSRCIADLRHLDNLKWTTHLRCRLGRDRHLTYGRDTGRWHRVFQGIGQTNMHNTLSDMLVTVSIKA